MPAVLGQPSDKDTSLLDREVRKRRRRHRGDNSGQMDFELSNNPRDGVSTITRNQTFRDGEWRESELLETTVIVTEPRATDKLDRDDGDSGISETAVEERLLPRGSKESGGHAPDYGNMKKESVLETLIQVFIPFMIAGFGMMAAGLLLDEVQVCVVTRPIMAPYKYSTLSPCLTALGSVQ